MKKILSVAGARPNFIKIAPLYREFLRHQDKVLHKICHTGQHFDTNMSGVFFEEFGLPVPDFNLGVGSGSHAVQTAKIMVEFEKLLMDEKPDLIIVPGDVNSTLACSVTASKMGIPVAHVEAGLRSFDRTMPEEINRIVTDVLSEYLFVSENSGLVNLANEGIDRNKVHFVGNIMIDSLVWNMSKIISSNILQKLGLIKSEFITVTFHRPSNVDDAESLRELLIFLKTISSDLKVVFPVHPRTKANILSYGFDGLISDSIILTEPLGYFDFLNLVKNSKLVVTDSGGIQEETTFLGVQCVTVRNNTERPVTVEVGTNHLVGTDFQKAEMVVNEILSGKIKTGSIPELWDGKTAERIVEIILFKDKAKGM